ncbi:hypothetical protein B0T24DRAFT_588277 [Lasiosphaeria ovina]|uniref:Uncharacterized protein n=1 Tax=Lasiosphaeria ovina TaxID=92902 RepID=A0AAE0NLG1_9PEZI|nr:hypothetical protein B0T24DRAFT_588277 [Lasiosphaeria ovina]
MNDRYRDSESREQPRHKKSTMDAIDRMNLIEDIKAAREVFRDTVLAAEKVERIKDIPEGADRIKLCTQRARCCRKRLVAAQIFIAQLEKGVDEFNVLGEDYKEERDAVETKLPDYVDMYRYYRDHHPKSTRQPADFYLHEEEREARAAATRQHEAQLKEAAKTRVPYSYDRREREDPHMHGDRRQPPTVRYYAPAEAGSSGQREWQEPPRVGSYSSQRRAERGTAPPEEYIVVEEVWVSYASRGTGGRRA